MLKHVDLCSGIGGFALGFEWAGLSKPVMFCDIEPWSRKILAKHWPDVPIEEDVKVLANDPEKIPELGRNSILTAGYPCQPFSQAGKRRGEKDDRHIWPYIREIVAHKRPSWCVFENVYGHVSMGLDAVLSDLEADGYATRPFIVAACSVDAPHKRDRVWIIARNVGDTENIGRDRGAKATGRTGQTHQQEQSRSQVWGEFSGSGENVANSKSIGSQGVGSERQDAEQAGLRSGETKRQAHFWKSEPSVGRVVDGLPRRLDRIKGLGNAIVPQIAMQIGLTIKAVHDV